MGTTRFHPALNTHFYLDCDSTLHTALIHVNAADWPRFSTHFQRLTKHEKFVLAPTRIQTRQGPVDYVTVTVTSTMQTSSSSATFPFTIPPTIDDRLYLPTPPSSLSFNDHDSLQSAYHDAIALFSSNPHYPQAFPKHLQPADITTIFPTAPNSQFRARRSVPTSLPHRSSNFSYGATDLAQTINSVARDRQMYTAPLNSMGGCVTQNSRGIKRQRTHQRTPSASTIASNGPASPYMQNGSHPQVANTDISPHSPAYYADQSFAKNLPTPSQTPTDLGFGNANFAPQYAQVSNAHLAMKDFAIQHHSESDFTADFTPSRQSMSSYGNDSPATPQSGAAESVDMKAYNGSTSDVRPPNPNVQLYRTESQAYQDEIYNPNLYTSAPAATSQPQPQQTNFLLPHRSLMAERLQTANAARSTSPMSSVSRERSPFRDGSPLAPTKEWTSPQAVPTVASLRQQQKQETDQAERERHQPPQLHREPTKTISPKDALLEYHDTDQMALFQDSVPVGYDTHRGGTEQWTANYNSFSGLPVTSQQNLGFRHATPAESNYAGSGFEYLPQDNDQIQLSSFQPDFQAVIGSKMNNFDNPHFPPPLPSMETSVSDPGPGPSSQEEASTSMPQRPDDTRANTGTYTCTYHGCTQRFDSHAHLQKHKREFHRVQQQSVPTSESGNGSASPSRSPQSPGPSGSGLSQADLLARNSQAGPHKCTRINPSTNKPCNTIFSRPYDLTRHEDTIHNNRKQKVKCQYCREDKTFSRNDALTRHMRVVHPEVSDNFHRRGRRGD